MNVSLDSRKFHNDILVVFLNITFSPNERENSYPEFEELILREDARRSLRIHEIVDSVEQRQIRFAWQFCKSSD